MRFNFKIMGVILLFFLLALFSWGCGGEQKQTQQSGAQGTGEQQKEVITLKLAHGAQLVSPVQTTAEHFAKLVSERSNGRLKIEIFGNMQLGQERDTIEGMQLGTVDMVITSVSPVAGFVPDVSIVDLPYLFVSEAHADKVLDGEIGQTLLKKLEPKGIIGLAWMENGFRHITANKKITSPADLKGLKIRVMQNKVHIATFKELGAAPVPMAWGEVYTSLQQKVIDGQENPLHIIYANALWEVQKYVILTGHFYTPYLFAMSKKTMDKLTPDLQKIIHEAAKETAIFERNLVRKQASEHQAALKAKGMEIVEVDKTPFIEATRPVYKQFENEFGKDTIEKIVAAGK